MRAARGARPRQSRGRSLVGTRYEVEVGPVAHGGHFVARHEGRVIFVRHAITGERVVVEITEGTDTDRFLRGDAVEVLTPSPDRVVPPCPYAGPGLCGGCDFQHIALPAQRELKARVLAEQLERLAGIEREVVVEPVPGDVDGLRWRTRVQWAPLPGETPGGRRGLRRFRSHEVVPVDDCLIARPDARGGLGPDTGVVVETVTAAGRTHAFSVEGDGFWQVHPGAPATLVEAVLDALRPRPGDRVADLYAGVGLFSAFLADAVGEAGLVTSVEGDRTASRHAADNLATYSQVRVVHADVLAGATAVQDKDLVVLDPPRDGARRDVVEAVARLRPRRIAYVACDPAALARDLAYFAERGYVLGDGPGALRAFDLFPMTHHVEAVATLLAV